jgi:HlyD family secretion protein
VNKKQEKGKKRRTGWWVLLGIVVVAGLIVGWRMWSTRQEYNQLLAGLETEPYQRSDLNAAIYGTGSVEPFQTAMLTWSASGTVGDVNVSLGQEVYRDDLLMSLTEESLSTDILQAQIDVINAENALETLYDGWESDLAQAKLDLLNAQEELDDLETEREIMNYQRCTDERIEDLEDELDMAETMYKFRQNADTLKVVNTAQANLDYCMADFTQEEIAEAELEVELAEAKVADLQEQVDILSDGPDPDQVTILETQLTMAQSRMDSPLIEAPFDGVVTILSAQIGDLVKTGEQAVQIDDLSELHLDVQISEVDIPQVEVGQAVELVFDAYYEETLTGEVTEIAPVGSTVQGVVEYAVRVRMLDADGRIKPGMTAAVTIVVEEKQDVFVVPNEAIFNIDGQDYVIVKRDGTYETVPVTLGSYSDYYSEVLEADISESESIVVNPPSELTGETFFENAHGPGFMFGN